MRMSRAGLGTVSLVAALLAVGGCADFFTNQTASLGGSVGGGRGTVDVLFINNTPFRAVMTYGSYEQTDQDSQPAIEQFAPNDLQRTLDGEATSDIRLLPCGRVFGVGSTQLLALIDENVPDDVSVPGNLPDRSIVTEALVEGVEFFSFTTDDEDDQEVLAFEGRARPLVALLGADFPCNSLLIVRLEFDDGDPDFRFRVDFELIPSESDR